MNQEDILIFIFWLLLVGITAKVFYNRIIVLIHIYKYKGRVMGKVINIRDGTHYYHFSIIHTYYPTYQYSVDGMVYEAEMSLGIRLENFYYLGQESLLYYDEKCPEKFVVPDERKIWKSDSILSGISFLFFLVLFIVGLIQRFIL